MRSTQRVTSACDRPLGESLVVLDETWQQLQVDDGAVPGRHQVDDLAHGGGVFVARYHDGAGPDLGRVARLIEESPQVARVIFIVEVCGDVHAVHFGLQASSLMSGESEVGVQLLKVPELFW